MSQHTTDQTPQNDVPFSQLELETCTATAARQSLTVKAAVRNRYQWTPATVLRISAYPDVVSEWQDGVIQHNTTTPFGARGRRICRRGQCVIALFSPAFHAHNKDGPSQLSHSELVCYSEEKTECRVSANTAPHPQLSKY
ncbi:hypothetical protein BaRGS_00009067 [Batillaria attramentaria]|uniref:Uncharacterized protein n=1 Tax=Batillaria attramentaria TaxID=370345 RepID=A0ABD0LKI8_9CAEN